MIPSIAENIRSKKTMGSNVVSASPRQVVQNDLFRAGVARQAKIVAVVDLGFGRPGLVVWKRPEAGER